MERKTTEVGAQRGAQLAPPPASAPVPEDLVPMSYEADVVQRVMGRYGVTNERLARLTGISAGTISRYLSGQYSVPLAVIRELLGETRDRELLDLLAPESMRLIGVPRKAPSMNFRTAFMAALKSHHQTQELAADLFSVAPSGATKAEFLESLRATFAALATLQAVVQENAA